MFLQMKICDFISRGDINENKICEEKSFALCSNKPSYSNSKISFIKLLIIGIKVKKRDNKKSMKNFKNIIN